MSNFCKQCYYDVKDTTGSKACPFNALYWNFLQHHRDSFSTNPRLSFMYAMWDKFKNEKKAAIISRASDIVKKMKEGKL
jgi:deoxyribodipyrimidine photolyase-related protein